MTKRELTLRFHMMNRAGTTMTVYSDGEGALQSMSDSFVPLRVEGEHFWLLFKTIGYQKDPQLRQTIKVVDHLVNAYLDDEKYGCQWLTVTLQDDQSRLYLIEIIEPFCEPKMHQRWREWQRFRRNNKEELEKVDAEILKHHQLIADRWES